MLRVHNREKSRHGHTQRDTPYLRLPALITLVLAVLLNPGFSALFFALIFTVLWTNFA